jgi:hypothetical protein
VVRAGWVNAVLIAHDLQRWATGMSRSVCSHVNRQENCLRLEHHDAGLCLQSRSKACLF